MIYALIKQMYINHKPAFLGGKYDSFIMIVFLKTVRTFRRLRTDFFALKYSIHLDRY